MTIPASSPVRRPGWDSAAAARRRARRVLAALAATTAVLLVAVTALSWALLHRTGAGAPVRPSPVRKASELTWESVDGVAVPVSRDDGPHLREGGRAGGYSRSERGAALAAVNVLIRTSPTAGPASFDPLLASQVTGQDLPAFRLALHSQYQQYRAEAGTRDGEPVPNRDVTRVLGYLVAAYSVDQATIQVVLADSQQVVQFGVDLVWAHGDWRVIAPPGGDWGTRADVLGSPPSGVQPYRPAG